MSGIYEGREEVPHLLQFSGKQEDWRMWSRKFIARASMMNYVDVLLGIEETPELLPLNVVESAEEIKLREEKFQAYKKANDMGHTDLMSAMTEQVSFGIVDSSISALLPFGDLAKAWRELTDMYQPSTAGKQLEIGQYVKAVPLQKQNKRMFPSHHKIHLPNQVNAYSWILVQCRQGVMEDPNSGAWLWMSFQK